MAKQSLALKHARAEAGSRQMFEDVFALLRTQDQAAAPLGQAKLCPLPFPGQLEAHRTPRMTRYFICGLQQSPGKLNSALPNSCTLPYVIHTLYKTQCKACVSGTPLSSGSLKPCPTAVHITLLHLSLQTTRNACGCVWCCCCCACGCGCEGGYHALHVRDGFCGHGQCCGCLVCVLWLCVYIVRCPMWVSLALDHIIFQNTFEFWIFSVSYTKRRPGGPAKLCWISKKISSRAHHNHGRAYHGIKEINHGMVTGNIMAREIHKTDGTHQNTTIGDVYLDKK